MSSSDERISGAVGVTWTMSIYSRECGGSTGLARAYDGDESGGCMKAAGEACFINLLSQWRNACWYNGLVLVWAVRGSSGSGGYRAFCSAMGGYPAMQALEEGFLAWLMRRRGGASTWRHSGVGNFSSGGGGAVCGVLSSGEVPRRRSGKAEERPSNAVRSNINSNLRSSVAGVTWCRRTCVMAKEAMTSGW